MKTILKFDTGADGFKKMMIVLAVVAVLVLLFGIYFLAVVHKELLNIS
jgi:competence protein ComGC